MRRSTVKYCKQSYDFSFLITHFSFILRTFALAFEKKGALSSAGLEHLPYKQRVGGSNPSTPTREFRNQSGLFFVNYQRIVLPAVNENKSVFILYFAHLFVSLQHI